MNVHESISWEQFKTKVFKGLTVERIQEFDAANELYPFSLDDDIAIELLYDEPANRKLRFDCLTDWFDELEDQGIFSKFEIYEHIKHLKKLWGIK